MTGTAENFLAGLRARLLTEAPEVTAHDDYDLAPELREAAPDLMKAAVLLPFVMRPDPHLIFTRRTETLARHSGQVSFPGGRSEPHDRTPVETALRETREETGIAPAFVTVAGYLDRYRTGTGFDIQPVVGVLEQGFALAPDPREVAEMFEVPLSFLLDAGNRQRKSRLLGGRRREFYSYDWQGHEIWGATAAIIVGLAQRLDGIIAL